jgi:WD40 repeat protein
MFQCHSASMNKLTNVFVLTCFLAISAAAQRAADAAKELEAAINKEVVQGDLKSAIGLYTKILSRYTSPRDTVAMALFHLGQCHEKLGQADARKSYERIVKEFADQKDLAAQARSRLTSLEGGTQPDSLARRLIDSSGDCIYVSQNGQWAACSRSGHLYVRNLSSVRETLAVRDVGLYDLAVLSPDGKWVAFHSNPNTRGTLWLVGADGSGRRKLEGPDNVPREVVFSDDGSLLFAFYLRHDRPGEIWLHSVQGGPSTKLYESQNLRSLTNPVFSPDGRFVIYRAGWERAETPSIWALPVNSGEPWKFNVLKLGTPAGFTSDGKLVIHGPGNIGVPSLWTVTLRQGHPEGEPQLLKRDVPAPGHYHPDGKYYYYSGNGRTDMLTAQLDAVPPLKARPASERNEGRGASPDYSRDGKLFAYISRPGGMVSVRNLETGAEKEYNPKLKPVRRVRWYPDGSALLVFGSRVPTEDVGVKLDLTTGEVSDVFRVDGKYADGSFNATVSPDGRYVYHKRFYASPEPRRVHRYEISAGKEGEIYRAPAPDDWLRLFSISPDGRQIAVVCSYKERRALDRCSASRRRRNEGCPPCAESGRHARFECPCLDRRRQISLISDLGFRQQ